MSFDLPSISNSVPIMLSHIFFSICITARLCRNKSFDQYGKSKRILLLHQFNFLAPRLHFLAELLGALPVVRAETYSNCFKMSSPVKFLGGPCNSVDPSYSLLLRHGWFTFK